MSNEPRVVSDLEKRLAERLAIAEAAVKPAIDERDEAARALRLVQGCRVSTTRDANRMGDGQIGVTVTFPESLLAMNMPFGGEADLLRDLLGVTQAAVETWLRVELGRRRHR